ncbi:MAG: ATP-binding protein [Bacteroidota bacterium]|nr:ATP-binding protein [Bacteroidota bacterium]
MNSKKLKNAETPVDDLIDTYRIFLTENIARNIAHEVRNPLTNIMLGLDQLRNEFPLEDNESAQTYFNIIKRNCDRINELISSLVNASKEPELTVGEFSLNQLMDEVLKTTDEKIKSGKITVQRKYNLQLPPILVDGEKIKNVLFNIILNAIQSMEGKSGKLEIQTAHEDQKFTIKIIDNGTGISNENLPRIFDPFFRVKANGTGLGLTTSQNIIHNHNGSIKANSSLGIGSTFTISL